MSSILSGSNVRTSIEEALEEQAKREEKNAEKERINREKKILEAKKKQAENAKTNKESKKATQKLINSEITVNKAIVYLPIDDNIKKAVNKETDKLRKNLDDKIKLLIDNRINETKIDDNEFSNTHIGYNYLNLAIFYSMQQETDTKTYVSKNKSKSITDSLDRSYYIIRIYEHLLYQYNQYFDSKLQTDTDLYNKTLSKLSPVFSFYLFYFTPTRYGNELMLGDKLFVGGFGDSNKTNFYSIYYNHSLRNNFGNNINSVLMLLTLMDDQNLYFYTSQYYQEARNTPIFVDDMKGKMYNGNNISLFPSNPFFKVIKMIAYCSDVYNKLPSGYKNIDEALKIYYKYIQGFIYDIDRATNEGTEYIYLKDTRPIQEKQIEDLKERFLGISIETNIEKALDYEYLKTIENDDFSSNVIYFYFLFCSIHRKTKNPFIEFNNSNTSFYTNLVKHFFSDFTSICNIKSDDDITKKGKKKKKSQDTDKVLCFKSKDGMYIIPVSLNYKFDENKNEINFEKNVKKIIDDMIKNNDKYITFSKVMNEYISSLQSNKKA